MVQISIQMQVLQVFFIEPTTVHFIKGISKKIGVAHTSVRRNIAILLHERLIKKKEAKPFAGFVANRDNELFIFYKRLYNLSTLRELTDTLVQRYYPKLIAVYGSYTYGEDVEESDIDLCIITKVLQETDVKSFEKKLKRKINIFMVDTIEKIDMNIRKKIWNGIVLFGGF